MNIEFKLSLKDMMSGTLPKVAAHASTIFGRIDQVVGTTQKNINNLGKGTSIKIDTSGIDDASRKLDNFSNKMNSLGSGGGMGFMKTGAAMWLGGLATQATMMAGRKLYETGAEALTAGMDVEQQIIGLSTFIGKDKATGLYKQLMKDAVLTPFTTSQILPGMQMLISAGETPERAHKDQWALMNALSATGNAGGDRGAFALSLGQSHLAQMASTGRADAFFMKEFQRTLHIPMERLLSDYMHVPQKTVGEWSHSGELGQHVSYNDFVGALDKASKTGGMFPHAMEAQSQTIRGKLSTILDWRNNGFAQAVLDPNTHANILRLEDRLISGLQDFPEVIGKISPVINSMFDGINEIIPSLKIFGAGLMDIIKPLGKLVLSDGVINLFKVSAATLGTTLQDLAPAFQGLAYGVDKLADSIAYWMGMLPSNRQQKKDSNGVPIHATQGFVWDDTTGAAARGMVVDTARMRKMIDSVNTSSFYPKQIFGSYKSLDSFNRSHDFDAQIGSATRLRTPLMKSLLAGAIGGSRTKDSSSTDHSGANNTSDAIVGGGRKQIVINVKSFVENMNIKNENLKDTTAQMKESFERMFLEVLQSANAAM